MNLKTWREKKGWSQGQVAENLGVDVSTVSRWESGSEPRLKQIGLISDLTGGKVEFRDWYQRDGGK